MSRCASSPASISPGEGAPTAEGAPLVSLTGDRTDGAPTFLCPFWRSRMHRFAAVTRASLFAAAALLAWEPAQAAPIKLAVINSMTGPEAPIGESLANGIQL